MIEALEASAERAFFLEVFRQRTLLITVHPDADVDVAGEVDGLMQLVETLLGNESRVVLLASGAGPLGARSLADRCGVAPQDWPETADALADLWIDLTTTGTVVLDVTGGLVAAGADLAVRLHAKKLLITDSHGGWGTPPRSFAELNDLGDAPDDRSEVFDAVRSALVGGVSSVNLCRLDELDRELFTFDGAGTLFTRDAYVQVTPLTLDDFPVVEELVARGVHEGFLRPRPRAEVVRIAFGGLSARVAQSGHIAGIGSLETDRYADECVGEVACLYTVNRFSGEGAGAQLLEGLVASAMDLGLHAVFACTVSESAAAFFERHGFTNVSHDRVPDAKWVGYDPARRGEARVLWLDLERGS